MSTSTRLLIRVERPLADARGRRARKRTVTDSDVVEARKLRDALVTILLSHSSDPATAEPEVRCAEAILERAGDKCPVAVRLSGAEARLGPGCGGVTGAFAGVLAAATELALSGQWARIKACRNEPCHFAFFDRSKNNIGGLLQHPVLQPGLHARVPWPEEGSAD